MSYMNRMLYKVRNDRESGSADIISALFLTPIILLLFFAIIDVSLWLNTKAHLEAASRDGVRVAAMWGGTSKGVRLNTTSPRVSVDTIIKSKMYDSEKGTCTRSHCTKPPNVKCHVGTSTRYIAKKSGETITCNITYYYKSIFPGSELLGFGKITQKPISYRVTGLSETGYQS